MATYAIGDLQGCHAELMQLLEQIGFNDQDQLWFTGDLVNRGPDSLQCLRFVKNLGERAVSVLGNHDLHLLALHHGGSKKVHPTLAPILQAPDRDELMHWLQQRPLLHDDKALGYVMTHAGIPHIWSLKTARALAAELEQVLRSNQAGAFFAAMYGNKPDLWQDDLKGQARLRAITNYFTRMRFITPQGRLEFTASGSPQDAPKGFMPWFELTPLKPLNRIQLFGHWAALGHHRNERVISLDTGCVWGNALSALRLDDGVLFSHPCSAYQTPGD
jgi:bis(5'-nucleosyl)-tetraphosphatase (symmetrical)